MNNILWALAIFFFVGIWIEVTLNLGYVGLMLGWIPALVVSYVWLNITGRMKDLKNASISE